MIPTHSITLFNNLVWRGGGLEAKVFVSERERVRQTRSSQQEPSLDTPPSSVFVTPLPLRSIRIV
jgi:hypothetical protein